MTAPGSVAVVGAGDYIGAIARRFAREEFTVAAAAATATSWQKTACGMWRKPSTPTLSWSGPTMTGESAIPQNTAP